MRTTSPAHNRYRPLYQTWTMVSSSALPPSHTLPETNPTTALGHDDGDRRAQVQQARIERRLGIPDLAIQVGCDPRLLSAYERGDEPCLPPSVREGLDRVLQLRPSAKRLKQPSTAL